GQLHALDLARGARVRVADVSAAEDADVDGQGASTAPSLTRFEDDGSPPCDCTRKAGAIALRAEVRGGIPPSFPVGRRLDCGLPGKRRGPRSRLGSARFVRLERVRSRPAG